ncbi:hypothetical protein chiPu_0016911 [Chiloscyllium punctatum]|uniref:TPX2 C-terminal domain-containing protein n=1 Tax=Chiloscyllium punctatum TaxID=137246 RepID=A0A401T711_CHIPU|nr:hypothetical protein [Chiloscyllium punctatum]
MSEEPEPGWTLGPGFGSLAGWLTRGHGERSSAHRVLAEETTNRPLHNLVTTLEAWKDNPNKTVPNKAVPLRRSTRRTSEQLRKQLGKIRDTRRSKKLESSEPPVNKKAKLALTGKSSGSRAGSMSRTRTKLTLPGTPTVLKQACTLLQSSSVFHQPVEAKTRGHKGATVPKPFNLSSGNKRKHEATNSQEYVSLAQQVEAFQCRTPSRYQLRSSHQVEEGPCKVSEKIKLTKPHTPMLATKTRARPTTCKSAAEIEAEELEKIQSYKFKAQEVNPRLLEGGPILPKKPQVKEPTKAIGFDLEIEKRIREREENKKPEEAEDHVFHSRPCPTKILEDVVGVPEKRLLPITMPKSPAFTMKNRVRIPRKEEKEEKRVIKANPMPHSAIPFKPKSLEDKLVEVQPFSFEARDKQREALKEKKIQELRKELTEFPSFKAQLLPDFNSTRLPEKMVKSPTKVQPFHLCLEERGAIRDQRWAQMMKEELRQQKEAACFKANPNSVIYREPFLPKKADRSLIENVDSTVQQTFELATEKRAKERAEFEMRKAEKEIMREQFEEKKRKENEEREREETARLRQELVHKANPVRHYKKVEIKPSEQQLTVPHTPHFSDRFRL